LYGCSVGFAEVFAATDDILAAPVTHSLISRAHSRHFADTQRVKANTYVIGGSPVPGDQAVGENTKRKVLSKLRKLHSKL
jgi:hypothetical protein